MALRMIVNPGVRLAMVSVLALLCVENTDGITCLECNAFFQGRRGSSCDEPMNRTDCAACLKVVTKVKMHDGWLIRRTSEVQTKYCARFAGSPGLKEEGCYFLSNNGGFTQQCYCYSDGCNKAAQLHHIPSVWTFLVLCLGLSVCLR